MNRSQLAIAAAILLATAATATAQQRGYQWKEANGVTHYTDMPRNESHKTRDIDNKSGNPTAATAAKSVETPQCQDARANLQRLQGGQALGIDTDGDGKADREISATERSSQTELNQAAVKAYCPPAKT